MTMNYTFTKQAVQTVARGGGGGIVEDVPNRGPNFSQFREYYQYIYSFIQLRNFRPLQRKG